MEKPQAQYYKCLNDDYRTFNKGSIYFITLVGKYVHDNPEDWKAVLPYPTAKEIIDCIENGNNKTIILKALKQWKNRR